MKQSRRSAGRQGDTRGEILSLLCQSDRTVSELAGEIGVSANAVRAHLERLAEEGLVRHRVVRRGVGKPAHQFRLTGQGLLRLGRGYHPLLTELLGVLESRWSAREVEGALRDAGRALARAQPPLAGDVATRARAVLGLLAGMGGGGSVEEVDGGLMIRGSCCPIGAVVPSHPVACQAMEAMVAELMGVPVQERCEPGEPARCRFVIVAEGAGAQPRG